MGEDPGMSAGINGIEEKINIVFKLKKTVAKPVKETKKAAEKPAKKAKEKKPAKAAKKEPGVNLDDIANLIK